MVSCQSAGLGEGAVGMSVVQEFRDREIARLEHSGWVTNAALRQRLEAVGLRPPAEVVAECLDERAGAEGEVGARWARAERAVAHLREHFAPFRFSDASTTGSWRSRPVTDSTPAGPWT